MADEVQNLALVPWLNICVKLKLSCFETATSQSTLTLFRSNVFHFFDFLIALNTF